MLPFNRAWHLVKKFLCWILIVNHGLLSIAQAFERTVQFSVHESGPQGALTLTVTKYDDSQSSSQTVFNSPLTPDLFQVKDEGLNIGYSSKHLDQENLSCLADQWLVQYKDEGLNDVSLAITRDGSIHLFGLESGNHNVDISAPGLILLQSTAMSTLGLTLAGGKIHNDARLSVARMLSLSASTGEIINKAAGQLIVNGEFNLSKGVLSNQGMIQTHGLISGSTVESFSNNSGTWAHDGSLRLTNSTLTLRGDVSLKGELELKSPLLGMPLTIENHGQAILKLDDGQFITPVHLINHRSLTLQTISKMTFASVANKGQLFFEEDMQIQPALCGGIEFGPIEQGGSLEGDESSAFVNSGSLFALGNLAFNLPLKLLGKAQINGNFTSLRSIYSLTYLLGVTVAKNLKVSFSQSHSVTEDLDLSSIKILEITSTAPLTIAALLTTNHLKLTSSAPIIIGTGLTTFGQVQAKGGDLAIEAPNITALYAKLYAQGKLHLKGGLTLGGYIEKSPNSQEFLGAWEGYPVDDFFQQTNNNCYRTTNGTMLYGQNIHLEGPSLSISYCTFFSDLLTRLSSNQQIHLLSVDFMGNGDLSATAPSLSLGGEKTGKALIERQTHKKTGKVRYVKGKRIEVTRVEKTCYDYLRSLATTINHLGDIFFTINDRIDFVGTSIAAKSLSVNGTPQLNTDPSSKIHFHPIHLGRIVLPRKVTTYLGKKTHSGLYSHSLGLLLAGKTLSLKELGGSLLFAVRRNLPKSIPQLAPITPPLQDISLAEICMFGMHLNDVGYHLLTREILDQEMRNAHEKGDIYYHSRWRQDTSWLVKTITPTLTLGQHLRLSAHTVHGQWALDTQKLFVTASKDIHFIHLTARAGVPQVVTTLVSLESSSIARCLALFQKVFATSLPGTNAPNYGEVPWLVQGGATLGKEFCQFWRQGIWQPPLRPRIQIPIDMMLQSVLAQKGRLYQGSLSGRELIQKWVKDSKALAVTNPVLGSTSNLNDLKRLLLVYLVQYDSTTNNYGIPELTAHVPEVMQNQRHGAGVTTIEEGEIQGEVIRLEDQEINVRRKLHMTGKKIQAQSTVHTCPKGRTTTQTAPSPMTINAGEGAQIKATADDSVVWKATQVKGGKNSTFEVTSGKSISLPALQMVDTTRRKKGYSRQGHHLASTIQGFEAFVAHAPSHYHQGVVINNGHNEFIGKNLKADSVIDYKEQKKKKSKRGMFRKKTSSTYTKMATHVAHPTYGGTTTLDIDRAVFIGAHFNGKVLDRTKVLELLPAVSVYIHKIKKNTNWGGVTKGINGSQGQEQVYPSEIHGEFISERHKDALDHENVLRLTSTILDLYDSQIDKQVIKSGYVPRKWSKFKQTGNFKAIALTVSAIVSVASMGWGSILMGFIQNAVLNAMATAAFSSVCSQAASSLVINQGNVKKVGKDLMRSETLKNVAVSAATAGATKGLLSNVNLPQMPELAARFTHEMMNSAIKLHVEYAIQGGSYSKLVKDHALDGLIATASGYLCNMAGRSYDHGKIDFLSHKIVHGSIGALTSLARDESVVAGAIGPMVAESVGELFFYAEYKNIQANQNKLYQQVQSGEVSPANAKIQRSALAESLNSLKQSCLTLGKYAAIAAATIAHLDPAVALRAATTALENDFREGEVNFLLYTLQNKIGELNPNKTPNRYQLILSMKQELEKAGASFEQINTLMNDPEMGQLINLVTKPKSQDINKASQGIPFGQKIKIEITQGSVDRLDDMLGIFAQGAGVLTRFNDRHPYLTKFTMTALQVALAGPVVFVRDQVLEAVGIHETVDALSNAGKQWFSGELQKRLCVDKSHADVSAEAGAFGIVFGVGMVGGASKDKVLQSAKETTEKVKSFTRGKGITDGVSKTVPTPRPLVSGGRGKASEQSLKSEIGLKKPDKSIAKKNNGLSDDVPAPGRHTETIAQNPVKPSQAVDKWDDFLGPKPHTNIHPRTGKVDNDRIVSQDRTKSIRYGDHEMKSRTEKHHYHEETWSLDPATNKMNVDNIIVRVPIKKD